MSSKKQSKNTENREHFEEKKTRKGKPVLIIGVIILAAVIAGIIGYKMYRSSVLAPYKSVVEDYNSVAEEYNNLIQNCVVDYIEDCPTEIELKEIDNHLPKSEMESEIDHITADLEELVWNYQRVVQLVNPSEEWVNERLERVGLVSMHESVTPDLDPNGLLGKEGGYTSCTYFTIKTIKPSSVEGEGIINKGTDVGGAIEVYETKEYALNRCDYLSQFDGTLLYSGSYVVVGTMVIRTSYILSDEEQVQLTNDIIMAFTEID